MFDSYTRGASYFWLPKPSPAGDFELTRARAVEACDQNMPGNDVGESDGGGKEGRRGRKSGDRR